jgi:Holliday junction DNA helicase RuvB
MTEKNKKNEDVNLDSTLRPQRWDEYIGQEGVKKNLRILIEAAQKRSEPIEHVLLHGPAGLGKTTLANLIARESSANVKVTSGPAIEKVGDLASILTNLSPGDVLFIDEAHRLNKMIEEVLYPAMEDFTLDIVIGKGPSARILQIDLPRFTLIAATTRIGLLSSPLRSRFGSILKLDFYKSEHVEEILRRSSKILNVNIDDAAIKVIARCSRSTPRVANRLLKRVRDYAQIKNREMVDEKTALETLELLEIDTLGLENADKKLLKVIIEKFGGGPVGISTLAAATMEEEDTVEDIYEPYLMQMGFLARTPKGRVATRLAYEYFGLKTPDGAPNEGAAGQNLFNNSDPRS